MKILKHPPRGILIIFLILILLGSCTLIFLFSGFKITRTSVHSVHNLEEQLSRVSELATVKYLYKDILKYENSLKIKEINIPLTEKKYLVIYGGYIKAGIDLDNAKVEIINNNTVHLTVSKARILDNVIDEKMTLVYNEKDGLFNKVTINDYTDVQMQNKAQLEEEVIAAGLLIDSEKNAKEMLTTFLAGFGFQNISIIFE